MNARTHVFEISMEMRQVEEAVCSIFHTLLFHRTWGKFECGQAVTYSMGTIGFTDVDCDFFDLTYVRVSSDELNDQVFSKVKAFSEMLRNCSEGQKRGQISLEFYQRKKSHWPFQAESTAWEVWTIKVDVVTLTNEHERQMYREKVAEVLTEKIFYITEAMNKHEYVPEMPNHTELELVFDTNYQDVQPYLFKIEFGPCGPSDTSVGTAMKKLIKDTLSL